MGGGSNNICYSFNSSIMGGCCNILSGTLSNSSIVGGQFNYLTCYSYSSSIIGGCCNSLSGTSSNSVILGGNNLTLTGQCNTALTQHLWIAGSFSPNCGTNFGFDGSFTAGANTITVCNGVIVSIT